MHARGPDITNRTERKDMAALMNAQFHELLMHPPHDGRIRVLRMTTGTTGGAPMMFAREHSQNSIGWFGDTQRVISCFGSLYASINYVSYFRYHAAETARILTMYGDDLVPELAPLLADFAPDRCIGWPFMVSHAAEYFDEKTGANVEAVRVSGELVGNRLEEVYAKHFPAASVRSLYAVAEISVVSDWSCPYLPARQYHPAPGVTIEILEPDEAGVGDILISTTVNKTIPIMRYRTGDVARMHRGPCTCGAKVIFELLGRGGYDFIKLAGALLVREEFDRVADLCTDLFDDYRIEASEISEGGRVKGRMVLRVYRKAGAWPHDVEREIAARYERGLFLSPTKTLGDFIERNLLTRLQVELASAPFSTKQKELKLSYHAE